MKEYQGVLNEFSLQSGLKINLLKSKLFITLNVKNLNVKSLSNLSGISLTQDLGKYNRSDFILDKIQNRLTRWKANLFSLAVRATSNQSVTSALHTYAMQTLDVPMNICKEIDKLNMNFLFGDTENNRKIHFV